MVPTRLNSCPCTDAVNADKKRRSRIVAFAVIVALATLVVWGETWAIEHAPPLPAELTNALDNSCGDSVTPVALIR